MAGVAPAVYRSDITGNPRLYQLWLESNEPTRRHEARVALSMMRSQPTFSILVPVYRPDLDLLERCIASVQAQSYPHWQLCLFDDASGDAEVIQAISEASRLDPRVVWGAAEENGGISSATNGAAGLATNAFFSLLDQDDELDPDTLTYVAAALDADPLADLVYTDEDKFNGSGSSRTSSRTGHLSCSCPTCTSDTFLRFGPACFGTLGASDRPTTVVRTTTSHSVRRNTPVHRPCASSGLPVA